MGGVTRRIIVPGRPDLDAYRRGKRFGVTRVKRHPEFVYSTSDAQRVNISAAW